MFWGGGGGVVIKGRWCFHLLNKYLILRWEITSRMVKCNLVLIRCFIMKIDIIYIYTFISFM